MAPSKGVEERYPALQEVTISRIGIPASASAKVAALIQADRVPKVSWNIGNNGQVKDEKVNTH